MKKDKILSKPFCIIWLAAAFIYGLVLPFCWGNNPASEMGTLSLLCEDRKIYFWIWGLLTAGSIFINSQYFYNKFSFKHKLYDIFGVLAIISVALVALTLGHSIEDWNPKRIAHWVATGMFIVFLLGSLALYFLVNLKKHKSFGILFICMLGIFASFLFIFIFIGKSALMEMIPVALLEIFLFIINFTSLAPSESEVAAV
ncbi:MAG: hypothetical protein J6Q79_05475 [Clostridia bacterium]|nr:hypothetical protein [Clostridia bacterium]